MTIRETQFDGVLVRYDGKDAEIGYTTVPQKMRAQTILAMKTEKSRAPFTVEEHPVFDLCGPMLDVSRGGVMTVEAVCRYLDKTAALGMNMLMLYTEDTYEVKEYPTFGYLRGRYTIEELRAIDDYAAALGIEVIPCIQTLGHLLKFTRWGKVPTDVPGVLLPGDEAVYRFIDAELRAIRAAFRSRRIHLGMDEAGGLARGTYMKQHGLQNPLDVFNAHLARVKEMAQSYGFSPMIWTDMYYSETDGQNYYARGYEIPDAAVRGAPSDVGLVFWDYYHTDYAYYDEKWKQQERFPNEKIFGGGLWTWDGFLPNFRYSCETSFPALSCAIDHGVKTVIATLWGDDGTETNLESAYALLPIFSEYMYKGKACTPDDVYDMAAYISGESRAVIDAVAAFHLGREGAVRLGKNLVYTDLFLNRDGASIDYAAEAEKLRAALSVLQAAEPTRFLPLYRMTVDAALKRCEILAALRPAYQSGDRAVLEDVAARLIPALREADDALCGELMRQRERTCKPFGGEVFLYRFGGMEKRLSYQADRIMRYLSDGTPIPELAEERLPGFNRSWRNFLGFTEL